MIIDKELLDKVSEQAKASPRLRMNYSVTVIDIRLCVTSFLTL